MHPIDDAMVMRQRWAIEARARYMGWLLARRLSLKGTGVLYELQPHSFRVNNFNGIFFPSSHRAHLTLFHSLHRSGVQMDCVLLHRRRRRTVGAGRRRANFPSCCVMFSKKKKLFPLFPTIYLIVFLSTSLPITFSMSPSNRSLFLAAAVYKIYSGFGGQ